MEENTTWQRKKTNLEKGTAQPPTKMETEEAVAVQHEQTTPLSSVVSDCVNRWFLDTLKEAKTGDVSMQVLVAQMYYSGYGVPKDANKGRIWITRASRVRSSAWKIGYKRPGYNASDSDTDEIVGGSSLD